MFGVRSGITILKKKRYFHVHRVGTASSLHLFFLPFCLLALIYSFAMKKDGWQGRNEGRILGKGSFQSVIPAFSLVLLI